MTTRSSDLDHIRRKLQHGLPPLTLDECRWLFALATGEQVESRKRCDGCGGSGMVVTPIRCGIAWGKTTCHTCGGSGYVQSDGKG